MTSEAGNSVETTTQANNHNDRKSSSAALHLEALRECLPGDRHGFASDPLSGRALTALLSNDLTEDELALAFVAPVLGWLLDPTWPVVYRAQIVLRFLARYRPPILSRGLRLCLEAVLDGPASPSGQAMAGEGLGYPTLRRLPHGRAELRPSGHLDIVMVLRSIDEAVQAEGGSYGAFRDVGPLVRRAASLGLLDRDHWGQCDPARRRGGWEQWVDFIEDDEEEEKGSLSGMQCYDDLLHVFSTAELTLTPINLEVDTCPRYVHRYVIFTLWALQRCRLPSLVPNEICWSILGFLDIGSCPFP
eukprot:CAMPEP_0185726626 /NCGR_PEP_ID=MMETSP1171-20130828/2542_1 /TAXON_ID=374046 /ORGANISM="Helicotheca tamensis, Strain CCMP826" /LENGTH=302 /DNA_ID=CAMNT_0028395011 /DNA_START=19 /DNA_END=927 /DNA_ORIENTATION=-